MKKVIVGIITISILFSIFANACVWGYDNEDDEEDLTTEELVAVTNIKGKPTILSRAALVYDRKYKKILYEKNIDEKLPNASTTKILTAIVAYENCDMSDEVIISERAAGIGGSTINLRKGNKVALGDLMKGLLICSGNDAAIAIAEHVAGSIEDFCVEMNKKAKEIGANNTNFVTPHGLDNDMHYTTERDLLLFTDYLLNIDYLANIVNMRNATIKIDNYEKSLHNTNEMLGIYQEANGVKTGYTSKAGRCLVTSMTRNGRQVISIVLGCDTKKQRTSESIQLLNFAYNSFEEVDIYENMRKKFNINISKSPNSNYEINLTGKLKTLLQLNEKDEIIYEYNIQKQLVAPIKKGDIIGTIVIKTPKGVLQTLEIKAPKDIKRKNVFEYFNQIMVNQLEYVLINV